MPSQKLLSFAGNAPALVPDGLELIRGLPGPIVPAMFIGDGRGGKSFLASKVAGDDALFDSAPTAEPVTEGIDVAAVPRQGGGHLLLFDAEGGDNALAASHSMVNVLGLSIATSVIFVASGRFSEESLQTLGRALAVRYLIRLDAACPPPSPELLLVVNQCGLQYTEGHLEQALAAQQGTPRAELRREITVAFPADRRRLLAVPHEGVDPAGFQRQLRLLREAVGAAAPSTLAGTPLTGGQLAELVSRAVDGFRQANVVDMPSVTRAIIFDGFLLPVVEQHVARYRDALPALADHVPDLQGCGDKDAVLADFDRACADIGHAELKAEARARLSELVDESWDRWCQQNQALGEQLLDSTVETREVYERSYEEEVGRGEREYVVVGPREAITVKRHVYRIESRTRLLAKNGTVTFTPWADTGRRATR